MVEHLEEFIDILEHVAPAFQYLFVFDNSSGHGAHAADALVASKMSKGWGGGQPKMRPGCYYGPDSLFRIKQHMVFQEGDPPPVSKCAARIPAGQDPPSYIGEAKGLHQVLHERLKLVGLVAAATKKKKAANRSEQTETVYEWLEENGGQVTGIDPDTGKDRGASAWPDVCGSAVRSARSRRRLPPWMRRW